MAQIFYYKKLRGRPVPMITIGVRIDQIWYPIEVYIDSGAAYTVLRAQIAEGIGFNYRTGQLIYLQVGDGSFIPVYLHELEMQLGSENFLAKVGFSEKLGVGFNLLGRTDIFERFKICFHESKGVITFE